MRSVQDSGTAVAIGNVFAIDEGTQSFSMSPSQFVTGASPYDSLRVLVVTEEDSNWKPRAFQLPSLHTLVSVTGTLQRITQRRGMSSPNSSTIDATISVDRLSHLSRPPSSSPAKKVYSTSAQVESQDVLALTNKVRKFNATSSIKKQTEPAVDSMSSKRKQKRKANAIEEDSERKLA